MIEWLAENISTIIIALAVGIVLATVTVKLLRDKKNGKSTCSCGCSGCPNASMCHKSELHD